MNVSGQVSKGGAQRQTSPESPARLGDALSRLIEDKIAPQQARFELVVRVWAELLPAELSEHCRIVDISAGRLEVLVDSPSYMCELRLCSAAVLKELRRQCPHSRLHEIKLAVG